MKNNSNYNMNNNNNNFNNNNNMNNGNNSGNNQDSGCKIFVGGLTWNTTKEMLFNEFTKFGEVTDSIVMKNPETGNSRGFGFITYRDNTSAENAVNSGPHKIDGKTVDVKLCNPRLAAQQRNNKQKSDVCKVFVGGLPHGVTDDEIKQFFSRYGHVKEFKMMYDENKQRPRGFGFITFESEESANQVLQEHFIQFNGKQIEVKPQIHNVKQQMNPHHQHQQQHMHHQVPYGGGWNQSWNSGQGAPLGQAGIAQAQIPNNASWGSYNNNMGVATQQWGYPGAPGHQQPGMSAPPYSNPANGAQNNWNYNYYGQPQTAFYQADSATANYVEPSQSSLISNSSTNLNDKQIYDIPPLASAPVTQAMPTVVTPTPTPPAVAASYPPTNEYSRVPIDFVDDIRYLPSSHGHFKHGSISTSSLAGTIGSSGTNANYSDSDTSSNSYYRAGSHGSNSSIAPSVSSLASSSIISSISSGGFSRSSNSSANSSSGASNQNHHHINTNNFHHANLSEPPSRHHRNYHHNHHGSHHHHRSGGSMGSSSDISSIYSFKNESTNEDSYYANASTSSSSSNNNNINRQQVNSSYHPYRR